MVTIDAGASSLDDLRELADYLSSLGVIDCDVVVLDGSPRFFFEQHRRVLRWVGRHVAAAAQCRTIGGTVDVVRAAAELAGCEKVIVAGADVRYSPTEIDQLCDLLEMHEVVEPQDYLHPLPWWGGIEAGRMLVHRGLEPQPDHGATFGFRRSAVRIMRGLELADGDDHARRLAAIGMEVHAANDVFVRRRPPAFSDWLQQRPRQAHDDFSMPIKSALFFAIVPLLVTIGFLGGFELAGGYAGAIACAAMILAVRGRSGAGAVFPLHAILFAPLWVVERSLSVYWALYRKVSGAGETSPLPAPNGARGTRVASGE